MWFVKLQEGAEVMGECDESVLNEVVCGAVEGG